MRTFTLTELLNEGPDTSTVSNEEGPMLPQDFRDELLKKAEEALSKIEAGIRRKERKIIRSFDRSSYRYWDGSPHQRLANSLEYLYGQTHDLREFMRNSSPTEARVRLRVLENNRKYSFTRVDEALKEPEYNYRNERQKARARRHYIKAARERKASKESVA